MYATPPPRTLPDEDSLHIADHPAWRNDPDYNCDAAALLIKAYHVIKARIGYAAGPLKAAQLALDVLKMAICERQRLRAMYILAQGYAAREDADEALGWVDAALDQTERVPEHPSYVDLEELRARLNIRRLEFVAAAEDFEDAATRVRALPQPWDQETVVQLMDILVSHALVCFYLSDAQTAQRLLSEARGLVPLAGDCELQVAGIELTRAVLSRHLGNAAEAAPIALRAATAFEGHHKPHSAVRAHVLLAGIYLDITQDIPDSRDRDHYFADASAHLATARALAKSCDDWNGAGLVTLEHVRLDRLRGRWQDRLRTIQRVIDGARIDANALLLVQALTTLGDEYRFLGETGKARKAYRDALAALGNHEITALAAPVRKALESLDP